MFKVQVRGSPLGCLPRATRGHAFVPVCSLPPHSSPASSPSPSRRESISGLVALTGSLLLQGQAPLEATAAGKTPSNAVETYLPKDESNPGFVRYEPDSKKTPAIRAGVIKGEPNFYSVSLPNTWAEGQLSNVLTGNFCMPRCDEPWVEFLFLDDKEGRCQLVVAPLFRLVSKANAQLSDVGPPETVVELVGNFITGNYLDSEDVLSATTGKLADGREAYFYDINAFYAQNGNHCLAAFTVKDNAAYLFVASATDKQWASSEGKLRTMVNSFKA